MMRITAFLAAALAGVVSGQPGSCDPGFMWNGRECVQDGPVTCSGSTPYKFGSDCYDSCPPGTYAYFSDCMTTCPAGTNTYNGNCVGGCPARTYNGACVDICPANTFDYNNGCVDSCPSYTVVDGSRCMDSCATGYYKHGSGCVAACPDTSSYIYKGECRDECWKSGLYYTSPGSKECVSMCPTFYEWTTNTCIDQCAPGQKISGTGCYDQCPSTVPYELNGRCEVTCPNFYVISQMKCVDVCPSGTVLNGKRCEMQNTPTCSGSQYLGSDNACNDYPSHNHTTVSCGSNQYVNSNGTCVDYMVCSGNQYLDSDGKCHNYQNTCPFWFNNTCVLECPRGTLVTAWNSCVDTCPEYMFRNGTSCVFQCMGGSSYNGTCVTVCPRDSPVSFFGKCVDSCPSGTYNMGDGVCEYGCSGFYLGDKCVDRCPAGMVTLYDKHCVERCPSDMVQNGTRCESHCPSTQYYMNGVCNDHGSGGNWTNPCPSGQYPGGADGKCVDFGNSTWTPSPCPDGHYMTSTGTCMKPCASDQWYWNNTCIPACRDGEALTMEGNCMNMAEMCRDALPGSVMNTVTRSCECPDGQWITRDLEMKDNTKMPARCSPGGPDRINCRSFVANTVYDADLAQCVCNAENPVVVPVADATWFPYACAPAGTVTTVKQCVAPEYFDFMEGRCVVVDGPMPSARPSVDVKPSASMSAKPKPSCDLISSAFVDGVCVRRTSTATRTAMPSKYPSPSSTSTRSAKPSNIPGSPSPSISASRSVKPSARVYADVSRKPLPSLEVVRPPPAEVRKSPAPSPWAKKVVVEIPPEEKPAYIDARMTVAGGNATEIAKPERIQQIQASLACTLRMPLENVRIQNITSVDSTGRKERVPVDPAAFAMVGDGSTDCYDFRNTSVGGRRMLRALGSTSGGAIEIDYAIIAPSDDILSMDTAQFNDVISQSPVMFAAAVAVGGISVTAQAVDSQKVDAPVPSASPQGTLLSSTGAGSTINDLRVILGAGIAGVALVVGATVLATFYYKEAKRAKRLLQDEQKRKADVANPRVVMVYTEDKHQIVNPLANHRAESTRFDYGPETTRRAAGPMKATHGALFGSAV
jgi:hypothetical protein